MDEGWEPAGHPHGTLMLARRAVLEEVGLFDERYFAYCEEADLALRAKAAGWETGLIRGAIVVNPDLGTRIAVIDYLQLRNTLLLVREHSGRYHATIRFLLAVGQLVDGPRVAVAAGSLLGPPGTGRVPCSTTHAVATVRRRCRSRIASGTVRSGRPRRRRPRGAPASGSTRRAAIPPITVKVPSMIAAIHTT